MKALPMVPVLLAATVATALAGEARVEAVRAVEAADGTFRFEVTVSHADEGWEHYADAFVVTAPDGTVLGTRTLLHPHMDEQPFTRSLSGVAVPGGVDTVSVHAVDTVHGAGPGSSVRLREAPSVSP